MAPKGDNLSAVLYAKDDLRLEDQPIREPKDDEVLLRMAVVGICGTDISFWKKGRIGDIIVHNPLVLGHETAGVVIKCGKNVKNLNEGDRVAIEPGVPCRVCQFCKTGRYNLCRDGYLCGLPGAHGNLCRFKAHVADFCHKLPDNVSLEEGALCEPVAVAIQACRRARVTLGHTVLICGSGPIGMATLIVARAMGASKIIVTDVLANRLEQARTLFGADHTVLVDPKVDTRSLANKVRETLGSAPDVSLECSGAEAGIALAILTTKSGGTVGLVGLGADQVTVPLLDAATREVDIVGSWCYANCYPTAIAMLTSGEISEQAKKLITHHYKLEETLEAYETMRNGGANGAIKVLIHC